MDTETLVIVGRMPVNDLPQEASHMLGPAKKTFSSILIGVLLLGVFLTACHMEKTKTYTVGFINTVPALDQVLAGFKEGMTELGYIEGKNIRYIYDGPTREMSKLASAAQTLPFGQADLILSITTPATLAVKQANVGKVLPVVFAIVTDPVGAGIVDSMQHPGGNITGVAFGIQEARRLEWLVRIAPGIRQIYVPYNPNDKSPVLALEMVRDAAAKLGVELITREVHDRETVDDAVFNIPAEADAIFLLPDSLMAKRVSEMAAAATQRNLPTSISNINSAKKYDVLNAFGFDQHLCGKQAARLADQIFKGTKPADLPVEMAEFFLAVNLRVAGAIGLAIPDEILHQADIIIR
jgi:putative tryptophan/tyrosine transport system substrate-binding protein